MNASGAADLDWSESFDQAIGVWLARAPLSPSMPRVLLAGSVPPDDRLHRAVEAAGGAIVCELLETQHMPAPKSKDEDILAALARRQHDGVSPAQRMLRSPTWISDQAQATRAQGVIIWLIEEDEALPWELATQTRALHAAHMPLLSLTRQPWRAAAALDSIASFVNNLERRQ
jgi:hypothetical protein